MSSVLAGRVSQVVGLVHALWMASCLYNIPGLAVATPGLEKIAVEMEECTLASRNYGSGSPATYRYKIELEPAEAARILQKLDASEITAPFDKYLFVFQTLSGEGG